MCVYPDPKMAMITQPPRRITGSITFWDKSWPTFCYGHKEREKNGDRDRWRSKKSNMPKFFVLSLVVGALPKKVLFRPSHQSYYQHSLTLDSREKWFISLEKMLARKRSWHNYELSFFQIVFRSSSQKWPYFIFTAAFVALLAPPRLETFVASNWPQSKQ